MTKGAIVRRARGERDKKGTVRFTRKPRLARKRKSPKVTKEQINII